MLRALHPLWPFLLPPGISPKPTFLQQEAAVSPAPFTSRHRKRLQGPQPAGQWLWVPQSPVLQPQEFFPNEKGTAASIPSMWAWA